MISLRQCSVLSPALVHRSWAIQLHDRVAESRCKVIGLALHSLRRSRELARGALHETGVTKEVELPTDGRRRCLQPAPISLHVDGPFLSKKRTICRMAKRPAQEGMSAVTLSSADRTTKNAVTPSARISAKTNQILRFTGSPIYCATPLAATGSVRCEASQPCVP